MSMVKIVMSLYIYFHRGKKRKNLLQEKALKFAADNCRLGIDFDGFQVRHINEVIGKFM